MDLLSNVPRSCQTGNLNLRIQGNMDASSLPRSVALVQAQAWADQKRWEKVAELIPRLLAENSEKLEAYGLATRARINSGEHAKAWKLAAECVRLGPDNADAQYLAAVAAHNVGKLQESQDHLDTALVLAPSWAALHQFQASLYLRKKKQTQAVAAIQRAKALAPENPEIAGELIRLESSGCHFPAEVLATTRRYEEALALDPDNPQLHLNLGTHLLNLQADYERARDCLGVALRHNPANLAVRRAYLHALHHTDPFVRRLCAPLWLGQRLLRILHQRISTVKQALIILVLAFPLLVAATLSIVYFSILCWLPAVLYSYLTLTDFRAQSTGARPGAGPGWRWSRCPGWVRHGTKVFLVSLPWLLIGLICWRSEILIILILSFFAMAWMDLAWQSGKWIWRAWADRRWEPGPKTAGRMTIIIFFTSLVAVLLVVDWKIVLGFMFVSSYMVVPWALKKWSRNLFQ